MKRVFVIKILWLLAVNIPFITLAQQLPKIQQKGIRAPLDIKIDGKTTEWNDQFQANNSNNRIYYTISNDDNNLYLALSASDGYGNEKAIFGITFTIKVPSGNGGKSKESVVVMYPTVIEVRKRNPIRSVITMIRRQQDDTTSAVKKRTDSLRLWVNKRIYDSFKEINVAGIQGIKDPSISIYNTDDIKVAAQINDRMQYTYELAIPLKYLGTAIINGQKFNYNIKMNGLPEKSPGSPYGLPVIEGDPMKTLGLDNAYVTYSTDFSGAYTLVQKQ